MKKVEIKIIDPSLFDHTDPHILPEYATVGSAGLDLRSAEDYELAPGESHTYRTGLAMYLGDFELCGMLVPRSSLGIKKIHLTNTLGIIDADYQGELMVPLTNNGEDNILIEKSQRIAQLVIVPVVQVLWQPVLDFSGITMRSIGGFGSTGTK